MATNDEHGESRQFRHSEPGGGGGRAVMGQDTRRQKIYRIGGPRLRKNWQTDRGTGEYL